MRPRPDRSPAATTGNILSRRALLIGAGGASIIAASPLRAQGKTDLTALKWDPAASRELWNRPDGPSFTIIDDAPLSYEGIDKPVPATKLTAAQIAEVTNSLVAACKFYRGKGMDAPILPTLSGKYAVFFLSGMGDVNGASGTARGVGQGVMATWFGDAPAPAPEGVYLMVNADNYFNPDADHLWAPRTTLAHELLHCVDRAMVKGEGWKASIGKWWTEGQVEATGQHAYRDIGYDPLTVLKTGGRNHAQNVGMRPYDYPLTLKGMPEYRPSWVRNGAAISDKEPEHAETFYDRNASYFTSSFWRYIFKEEAPVALARTSRPGYFELMSAFRRYLPTKADVDKAAGNPHMDSGVAVLDRFLRAEHPVWKPTGLHRAFPAFIAHFIEWPDQVVKSRAGLFAHSKWLDVLFMKDVHKPVITADQSIEIELEILPLAARAIRFEVPATAGTGDYPSVTIGISVIKDYGQSNAIDSIHVGLRGQCLANNAAQMSGAGRSRVRRWINVKAIPLNRRKVKNETVLSLINVAPDPTATRPIRVRLTIVLQVASSIGQVSYHPDPVSDANGNPVPLPPSVAPSGPVSLPVIATTRGASETKVVLVKDADLVRMMTAAGDINTLMALERETEDPVSKPDIAAMTTAMAQRMQSGAYRALSIELTLPRIEPGFTGSVSGARAAAEWPEPRYAQYAQYGVNPGVRIETDAVQVQITGSTDSSLLGTFSADFDNGSDNQSRIFRGRIEGSFSVGIAHDEANEDGEPPEDPSAILPTDFFVMAARAGMDSAGIAAAIRDALDGSSGERGPAEASVSPASPGGAAGSGVSGGRGCRVPVTRADFERYFDERIRTLPGLDKGQIAEVHDAMLKDWQSTEQAVCFWKVGAM